MPIPTLPEKADICETIMAVLQFHVGQSQAINRWELVVKVFGPGKDLPRTDANPFDRAVRKAIEHLRHTGEMICNLGDGSGFFLPASHEEYNAFRACYGSHAFPIMEAIHEMDRTANQTWPNRLQPSLL